MRALAILVVLSIAPLTDAITQELPLPLERGQRVRVSRASSVSTKIPAFSKTVSVAAWICSTSDWFNEVRLNLWAGSLSFGPLGIVVPPQSG